MNDSLQVTVDKFKTVMEEMQKKVTSMKLRMDEVYKKINQLEANERSLATINNQLSKELCSLSYQVSLVEDHKAKMGKEPKVPKEGGSKSPARSKSLKGSAASKDQK